MNQRDKLLKLHQQMCLEALEVMKKKNHDYAGKEGTDPYANFRRVETMGICSTLQGFLVRLTDKLSRLSTFVKDGELLVKDETVRDTLIDMINYPILLQGFLDDQKEGR
jgi:hypothetical protein